VRTSVLVSSEVAGHGGVYCERNTGNRPEFPNSASFQLLNHSSAPSIKLRGWASKSEGAARGAARGNPPSGGMVPHASGERVAEQDLPAAPFAPLAPSPAAEPQGAVARDDMLRFLGPGTSGFDENGELCILKDRLYLASLSGFPSPRAKKYYITLSKKMRYMPFCADFGPFNLGMLAHTRTGADACADAGAACHVAKTPLGDSPHERCACHRARGALAQLDAPCVGSRRHTAPHLPSAFEDVDEPGVAGYPSGVLYFTGPTRRY